MSAPSVCVVGAFSSTQATSEASSSPRDLRLGQPSAVGRASALPTSFGSRGPRGGTAGSVTFPTGARPDAFPGRFPPVLGAPQSLVREEAVLEGIQGLGRI